MKIAIVGAGPAGVFCALKILELRPDIDVTIFEKNSPLKTLLQTGNGRCNLAYNEFDPIELAGYYPRGEKFLYSIFSRFALSETLADFEKIGVKTYAQDDNRIFPIKNSAKFVCKKMLSNLNVKFVKKDVKAPLEGFDGVVLATGLKTGADLAKRYGHKIIPLRPSLCGLKIRETGFKTLEGVSFGGIIFTSQGVSGPFIYKLSSINAYREFPYEIKIPLANIKELTAALKKYPKKQFKTVLGEFIPKSLANLLIKEDKKAADVSKKEIEAFSILRLTAEGRDNKGEIVHAGGADLDEIDRNLKSKIVPNLWIIGELLNIDGLTGGFNLQNCWSTAAIAAYDICLAP